MISWVPSRLEGLASFTIAKVDPAKTQSDSLHDDSLIDWFLSLTPAERLAELESRLEFFNAVRRDGDTKLPPNTRDP
jgi:hypothetical protein